MLKMFSLTLFLKEKNVCGLLVCVSGIVINKRTPREHSHEALLGIHSIFLVI